MANHFAIATDATLIAALKGTPVAISGKPARVYQDLMDGAGLFVAINAKARTGYWKYQYTSPDPAVGRTKHTFKHGKVWIDQEGKLAGMTREAARAAHLVAREQVAAGIDPNKAREEEEKAEAVAQALAEARRLDDERRERDSLPPKDSFWDVFLRLEGVNATRFTEESLYARMCMLKKWAYNSIGKKHVAEVNQDDVHEIDTALVGAGMLPTLIRVRSIIRQVCAFAMLPENKLRPAGTCPVFDKATLWDEMESTPRPALEDPAEIGELVRAVRAWSPNVTQSRAARGLAPTARKGYPSTPRLGKRKPSDAYTIRNAVLLLAYTGQRSHMVRQARKEHFNFEAGTWTVPAVMMKGDLLKKRKKGKKPHVVFLARQVIAILKEQFAAHPDSPFVFPGQGRSTTGMIGKTSMLVFLERLGYSADDGATKGKHVPHGFRAVMRTAGEERAAISPFLLERALAHKHATQGLEAHAAVTKMLTGNMPGVYKRATSAWDEQQAGAYQAWADYLDTLARPELTLVAA